MPIYKCHKCGCAENTATGNYWMQERSGKKPVCSECETGAWHGEFEKRSIDELGYVELETGFYGPIDGSWGKVMGTEKTPIILSLTKLK